MSDSLCLLQGQLRAFASQLAPHALQLSRACAAAAAHLSTSLPTSCQSAGGPVEKGHSPSLSASVSISGSAAEPIRPLGPLPSTATNCHQLPWEPLRLRPPSVAGAAAVDHAVGATAHSPDPYPSLSVAAAVNPLWATLVLCLFLCLGFICQCAWGRGNRANVADRESF